MEKRTDFSALYDAVLSLSDRESCRLFFDDLCTIKELEAMAQRLEVAQMLSEKKTFNEIAAKTGASTATISRVNRCLQYGGGGYAKILEKQKS